MSADQERRKAVQYKQFKAFADAHLAKHGREPSIRSAVAALGGSNTTISAHKRVWLSQKNRSKVDVKYSNELPDSLVDSISKSVTDALTPVWLSIQADHDKQQADSTSALEQQHEAYVAEIESIGKQLDEQIQENQLAEVRYHEKQASIESNLAQLDSELQSANTSLEKKNEMIAALNSEIAVLNEKLDAAQKTQATAVTNYLKQLSDQESQHRRALLEKDTKEEFFVKQLAQMEQRLLKQLKGEGE